MNEPTKNLINDWLLEATRPQIQRWLGTLVDQKLTPATIRIQEWAMRVGRGRR